MSTNCLRAVALLSSLTFVLEFFVQQTTPFSPLRLCRALIHNPCHTTAGSFLPTLSPCFALLRTPKSSFFTTPEKRTISVMPFFERSLAGPGYVVLNTIRVCNIICLLSVIAAAFVMLVKTFVVSKFFFFDGVSHIITAFLASECSQ